MEGKVKQVPGASDRNGEAGEVRSKVVHTVSDLKGLLFLPAQTS